MGLSPDMTSARTAIAPAPRGILDPATGKPVGANDPYFREISAELADKGFLVTSAEDLITWARTGSLMGAERGLPLRMSTSPWCSGHSSLPSSQ